MSIEVIAKVLSRKVGSATKKAVLLVMADAANDDGTGIWVSKLTISQKSELSRPTVKRVVKKLVEDRLIIAVGKYKISNGFTTVYNINMAALNALDSSKVDMGQNEPRITLNPVMGTERTLTGGHSEPQTVLEPSLNRHSTQRESVSKAFVDAVRNRWEAVAIQHGYPSAMMMNAQRVKLIEKRLAECGGDESKILRAIDNMPNNTHWTGRSGDMSHITFEWVFGPPKPDKPDRFIEAYESKKPQTPKAQHDLTQRNRFETNGERKSRIADEALASVLSGIESGGPISGFG